MVFLRENPCKIDDLGLPLILETSIWWFLKKTAWCAYNDQKSLSIKATLDTLAWATSIGITMGWCKNGPHGWFMGGFIGFARCEANSSTSMDWFARANLNSKFSAFDHLIYCFFLQVFPSSNSGISLLGIKPMYHSQVNMESMGYGHPTHHGKPQMTALGFQNTLWIPLVV